MGETKMIKKSIFLGIFILLLASFVSAAGNLVMSSPAAITVVAGQSGSSTFNMQNLANATLPVSLSAVSSVPLTFNTSNPNIGNLGTETVTVTANAAAVNAGSYTATIVASHENITTNSTFIITVRNATTSLTIPSSVYLGSTSGQERNKSVTGSFTISNPGSAGDRPITAIEVSSNAASKYLVNFSLDNTNFQTTVSGFNLLPGESKTIYYKGFVPADATSGTTDIGDITVKSNEVTQTITGFYTNTPMMLVLYDINVNVDEDRDSSIDLSGDKIGKKAAPGSVVKIEIKLENKFSDDSDIDLEDVKITADIEDMDTNADDEDDEDPFEEETDDFKINADSRSDWQYLTFNIPYDAEEGTYDINIEAVGTDDEYDVEHTASITLKLEVERESHFVKIMKAKLGSEDITCNDYTTLNVLIQNIGADDEDEAVLTVKNPTLGLTYTSSEMELSEDPSDDESEFGKVFTIDLTGKDIKSGVYPIEINTFYSTDILSDTETVQLTVTCQEEAPVEEEETKDETVVLEEEATDTENQGGAVAQEVYETTETQDKGLFGGDTNYTILLVLANVIIIIIAIVLVFKFLLAPKN